MAAEHAPLGLEGLRVVSGELEALGKGFPENLSVGGRKIFPPLFVEGIQNDQVQLFSIEAFPMGKIE